MNVKRERGKERNKKNLEIKLINVLMWEIIYAFVSMLFSYLSSSSSFVIPKAQESVISLSLVAGN